MKIISIYALIEPIELVRKDDYFNGIRYIGKTNKPLLYRLKEHVYHSNKGEQSHKANWIRKVLCETKIPQIIFLGEVPEGHDWEEYEKAWIKYFREEGCNLTNMCDGGNVLFGLMTDKNYRKTPEYRQNIVTGKQIGRAHV